MTAEVVTAAATPSASIGFFMPATLSRYTRHFEGNNAIPHTPSATAAATKTHHSTPRGRENHLSAASQTTLGTTSASPKNVSARQSASRFADNRHTTPKPASPHATAFVRNPPIGINMPETLPQNPAT